jgi:hypothetical protein
MAMFTNTRTQGDRVAALHLESLFDSSRSGSDKNNRATFAAPAIRRSTEYDSPPLRHRLAFIKRLADSAQGLSMSIKTDVAKAASIGNDGTDASRAAANVAAWRAYLPEDCVIAMIRDGWHRST